MEPRPYGDAPPPPSGGEGGYVAAVAVVAGFAPRPFSAEEVGPLVAWPPRPAAAAAELEGGLGFVGGSHVTTLPLWVAGLTVRGPFTILGVAAAGLELVALFASVTVSVSRGGRMASRLRASAACQRNTHSSGTGNGTVKR